MIKVFPKPFCSLKFFTDIQLLCCEGGRLKSTYKKYFIYYFVYSLNFSFSSFKKRQGRHLIFPWKKKDRIIAWSHSRRSQLFEVGVFKRSLLKFRHRHFFNYNCIAIASILGSFVWLEGHSGLKNLKKFNLDKSKRATKKNGFTK